MWCPLDHSSGWHIDQEREGGPKRTSVEPGLGRETRSRRRQITAMEFLITSPSPCSLSPSKPPLLKPITVSIPPNSTEIIYSRSRSSPAGICTRRTPTPRPTAPKRRTRDPCCCRRRRAMCRRNRLWMLRRRKGRRGVRGRRAVGIK